MQKRSKEVISGKDYNIIKIDKASMFTLYRITNENKKKRGCIIKWYVFFSLIPIVEMLSVK